METKAEANQLWEQLKNNLLGTQETLEKIITTRAWEPLGFATFHEAWSERMSGVKLAGAMEATVVYALFEAGATDVDVALSVDGVGPKRARAYAQAHGAGLPVASAGDHVARMLRPLKPGETVIPAHIRRKAERKNSIRMEGFTDDEIQTWKRDAEEKGVDWRDYCAGVFRDAMNGVSVVNGHVNA